MEFGIFLTMPSPDGREASEIYSRGIDMVQTAEALGFTRAWVAEHHFSTYSYISCPMVFLANLAARTDRIRLGTAIIPIPLHNPLIVAEELATLDVLCGGRVDVGIGKGYQKYQFDRLAVKKDSDPARYAESVVLLKKALSGGNFEHHGRYFQIEDTTLLPQPIQKPPPFWLVVNTLVPESVEFALQLESNIFTGVLEPLSDLTNVREQFPKLPKQGTGPPFIGTQRPVYISDDPDDVRDAVEHLRWNARVSISHRHDFGEVVNGRAIAKPLPNEPSAESIIENNVVFGSPSRCIHQLERLQSGLGCNYFSASFWFGGLEHDRAMRSMERFAKEVVPHFDKKQIVAQKQ